MSKKTSQQQQLWSHRVLPGTMSFTYFYFCFLITSFYIFLQSSTVFPTGRSKILVFQEAVVQPSVSTDGNFLTMAFFLAISEVPGKRLEAAWSFILTTHCPGLGKRPTSVKSQHHAQKCRKCQQNASNRPVCGSKQCHNTSQHESMIFLLSPGTCPSMSTKAAPPDTKYQPRPSAKQVVITAGSPSGMAATASATAILQNSADDRPYQSIISPYQSISTPARRCYLRIHLSISQPVEVLNCFMDSHGTWWLGIFVLDLLLCPSPTVHVLPSLSAVKWSSGVELMPVSTAIWAACPSKWEKHRKKHRKPWVEA